MARKCPRQIRKIRSVGSILDGFGEHERVSTKNSAYSSRRDDASRRKLSQDRWCHLSRAKFTRLEIEPPFPNRAFHRRFRCTAFLQTYYYRPPLIDADFRQPGHELFIESIGHRYFLLLFHVLRFFEIVGLR